MVKEICNANKTFSFLPEKPGNVGRAKEAEGAETAGDVLLRVMMCHAMCTSLVSPPEQRPVFKSKIFSL
jgi:hypothetical protein